MDYKNILEAYVENSGEGIIITDKVGGITFYKESINNITGIGNKKALGKNILEIFPYLTEGTSSFYQVIKNNKPIINRIQKYKNNLGKTVSVVTSTIPIFEKGEFIGAFEIFKDFTLVSELSQKILSLEEEINRERLGERKEKNTSGAKYNFEDIIYKSHVMKNLIEDCKKICKSPSPVLVYGETGTGKELLVQSIHNGNKLRSKFPFIAQNCAAIPHNLLEAILFGTEEGSYTGAKSNMGLLELASGGTLFLDEINSMDIELQGKLLRFIQEGEVRRIGGKDTKILDVRIIASTNEEPIKLLKEGRLRHDLYYRLNVIFLEVPPLRERKEDIEVLTEFFVDKYNITLDKGIMGVNEEVLDLFNEYPWPGNVRELQHVIERAMNWSENNIITSSDISIKVKKRECNMDNRLSKYEGIYEQGLASTLKEYEEKIIRKSIIDAKGNYSKAARLLKVPKQTFQNKVKKYNIEKEIVLK
ncbi:sigma-54 interaction domain-containing protein [Clostridium hydrogeniformans]|uniref:sigma-54 interaction domain-containing protein n=1 Tax=Clostridium hydrogeniformans TaxID=349933 RepID=UPI00047F5603|nr:sigma 54-interacting transcriptional regulator [Clostridium hydrogeniformans]